MDVQVEGEEPQRIVIGLFGDVAPTTVQNFVGLITDKEGAGYRGSSFYRVVSGLTVQGGDIPSSKGKQGRAILPGGSYMPENFDLRHSVAGLISMCHARDGKADSRFLIQTKADSGYLDGRYIAFGRVLEGMSVIYHMEEIGGVGPQNRPKQPVTIVDCGLLDQQQAPKLQSSAETLVRNVW
ncbi:Peptidyl-prolyl cis-trans isomerase B1 [Porphyridium purpureum]|uniref:Peptidyl-prolyl cis-trans isomerase n=1 Tax=Porphyridium purpureum TaxID=35688 RepID=A0A5J4Z0I4_PORPP|nr:Peptidyl-prolyl cis-trans isomerase B1 [Porphyridium purpureum]|eukprot:POR6532..scf208_2